MSTWTLIQIVFDIFIATGLFTIVMRMNRAPKDDPRLSRGLQLLQSKISVLEDLSDRTEVQVNQLAAILEQKSREVQAKVQLAEQHVHEIRVSMERSLEVAQIFQDKIPHKEIIERQNTIKYVQAARLAHQGATVEEIAAKIDLPKGEVEFIASVNRERLMFDENDLPAWARTEAAAEAATPAQTAFAPALPQASFEEPHESQEETSQRLRAEMELAERQRLVESLSRLQFEMKNLDIELARESSSRDLSGAFEVPRVETDSLKKLGEEFRRAVEEGQKLDSQEQLFPLEQITQKISHVMTAAETAANNALSHTLESANRSTADFVPTAAPTDPILPASFGGRATAATLREAISTASAAVRSRTSQAVTEAPRDPVLARAMAQQKIQAALKATAPAKPEISPELQAARAMAKEASDSRQPVTHIVRERTLSGAPASTEGTVIKKVLFPRIDETEV